MTICIAALCDGGKGSILVSDQMITAHFPIGYEFENNEVEKIVKINENVHALVAGDVLFADEVIGSARKQIILQNVHNFDGIAEILRNEYQVARRNRVGRQELEPRGMDLGNYFNLQQRLQPAITQMIDMAFKTYDPGVELIIAGKSDAGCHICTIRNPGDLICHDAIGFVTIGSGGPHAVYSMIESGYKKSLPKDSVREIVLKAKKRSEVAPGVGKETTVIEISL